MKKYIIIHYYEIALKGANRPFFENRLIENIKATLKKENYDYIQKNFGRIILKLNEKSNEKKIKSKLKNIFGIAYFALAFESSLDLLGLSQDILEKIKVKKFDSFKINAKRSNKQFYLTSQEVNEKIGAIVKEKLNKKVDLENPDLTIYIELLRNQSFFYFEKNKGLNGLPIGVSGKVVSLISSGFDSPVASYLMMKRGCEVIFIHFFSYPQTTLASKENVEKIIKILNNYQNQSKIYFVPFLDIQKEITINSPSSLRIVFYRRAMLKIAEMVAKKEGALALVTGDSVGQVASQTLENISTISEAIKLPILRPLAGMNKEEIMTISKKIGTFKISSLAADDCCNLFTPTHPETKANLKKVKQIEKKIKNLKKLIKKAFKSSSIKNF